MSINYEQSTLLTPPAERCVNCSSIGIVSEIHIYDSNDVFEKRITIFDALCQIFNLHLTQDEKLLLMCTQCAGCLSYMYQAFMNLLSLSTTSCYLTKMLVQIANWHFKKITTNIPDETYNLFRIEQELNQEQEYLQERTECQGEDWKRYINAEADKGDIEIHEDEMLMTTPGVADTKIPEPIFHTSIAYEASTTYPDPPRPSIDMKSRSRGKYVCRNINQRRYFKCNLCPAKFIPIFELHEHILSAHESKSKSECDKCQFAYYPEITKFETHICIDSRERNIAKKARPFLCVICGARFGGERLLTFHTEKVHTQEDVRFRCHYCSKQLVDRHKLYLHMEVHASSKTYLCSECGRSFAQKRGLDKHLEIHFVDRDTRILQRRSKEVGVFPCSTCNRTFSYKRNLQEHQRMHVPEDNKFRCPVCKKPHWTRKRLEKHILSHNPKHEIVDDGEWGAGRVEKNRKSQGSNRVSASLKCSSCSKEFKSRQDLVDHEGFTHLNSLPCGICGKPLSSLSRNLDVHLRTHMSLEEKLRSRIDVNGIHSCPVCPKVYSSLQDLLSHSIVHGTRSVELDAEHSPKHYAGERGHFGKAPRQRKVRDWRCVLPPKHKTNGRGIRPSSSSPAMSPEVETDMSAAAVAAFEEMEGKRVVILIERIPTGIS